MIGAILDWSARHRGVVLFATALAALAAALSVDRLAIDATPDHADRQVIVVAEWPGRSANLIEARVTSVLGAGLVGLPSVAAVRGTSMAGMSFIHIVLEEGAEVGETRARVAEQLAALRARLPDDATPTLGPDASAVGWVYQYTLVDRAGRLDQLRAFQDLTLRPALGSLPGVAEVAAVGGHVRELQVTVDPQRLAPLGIRLSEVIDALRAANMEAGGQSLELDGREVVVRGRGAVTRLADLETAVVRGGPPTILIRDLATVGLGPAPRRGAADWNGEGEAVGGIVVMRQGENALRVIEAVEARLDALRPAFPAGVELHVAYDRSGLIHRALATLRAALIEEGLAVSLCIFLLLLHLRSALLPALSLPLVVLLGVLPMVLFGVPATIMSLGGIAIALGATIDAEIVMIEACHRRLESATSAADRRPLLAAAARQVTPAIFFSLLVVAVAFLPAFALTGQAARLFRPLAFTKTAVMVLSAILSITFAPAMRDFLLRGPIRAETSHPLWRLCRRVYQPFVLAALRNPRSTLLIGVLAIASAVPVAMRLGHEFMPPLDEGDLLYMPTTATSISLEEAKRQLQRQDAVLRSFPEVASVSGKVGRASSATDPAPITMIETTVRLRPRDEWRPELESRDDLVRALDARMQFPGWSNAWTMPIQARVDMLSSGVRTPVGLKIFGPDRAAIDRAGLALERVLASVPGTRHAFFERGAGGLYADITPDREALARAGVRVSDLLDLVEGATGGRQVGHAIEGRARLPIRVRFPPDTVGDLDSLRALPVPVATADAPAPQPARAAAAASGDTEMGMGGARRAVAALPSSTAGAHRLAQVPLSRLARVELVEDAAMIRSEGGLPVGYLHVDLDRAGQDLAGYLAGARAAVDRARATGEVVLGAGVHLAWTGQYEQMLETEARLKVIIPLTLLAIFLLLYLHFRSAAETAMVLLSVPFALVGSFWLLDLLGYHLSTAVWIGLIAVVGLAAQTGVVMVVYIDEAYLRRKRAGLIRSLDDIVAAHLEGTVQRLRPKLMTVSAMLAGLLPLLWATSSGADVMKRIAAPMVGGLISSTFLTLEIIPVVYTYWRAEQLLWERAAGGPSFVPLSRTARRTGWAALATLVIAVLPVYLSIPGPVTIAALTATMVLTIGFALRYRRLRIA
ncbi:MAG TPA: efflux RND transporter permease subunit [Kofleriaceae bacterium]|nr:efflux RND transporter permease subunit [Kofleriaceae bacterium]